MSDSGFDEFSEKQLASIDLSSTPRLNTPYREYKIWVKQNQQRDGQPLTLKKWVSWESWIPGGKFWKLGGFLVNSKKNFKIEKNWKKNLRKN